MDFLPTILHVTNTKEVLEGEEITLFCVSKGQSDTVKLFDRRSKHSYLVANGKGFLKKIMKLNHSSTYVCEVEASGVRAKEDFSITVAGAYFF